MLTFPHTPPHTPPLSNSFLCFVCEKQFRSLQGLTQHTRIVEKYNLRQDLDEVPDNTITEFKETEIHKKLVLNFRSMEKKLVSIPCPELRHLRFTVFNYGDELFYGICRNATNAVIP